MPSAPEDPSVPSLDRLRKTAKQLLRACHAADPAAWRRIAPHVPRLAARTESDAAREVKLADVQHALAREWGHESWAALKHAREAMLPWSEKIETFLAAVRAGDAARAIAWLEREPAIMTANIFTAACVADAEAVGRMLSRDASLAHATMGGEGWTPLQYVCHSNAHTFGPERAEGSRRAAEQLLDAGADPNVATRETQGERVTPLSALYRACECDNVPVVKLLLERGANPNDDESVYHAAEKNRRACLEHLLAHGANLSAASPNWGNTPLYFLAGYREDNAATPAATEGMRWLLEHGADPNVPSGPLRETPLHRMLAWGRGPEAVAMMLDHGADATRARTDGRTVLACAVRGGRPEVLALLRSRGVTGDVPPLDAFVGACLRGARQEALAIREAHPSMLEALDEEDREALVHAAGLGRIDAVETFLACGFDLAFEGHWAGTALHWAAWNGRVELVRWLIEHRAPLDARDREFGSSPLGWAAHGAQHCRRADDDYLAVIDLLIDAGATFEASCNRWGEEPYDLAPEAVMTHLARRGYVKARPAEA